MSAYDHFLMELLGDPGFAPSVPEIRRVFTALDIESDGNSHALQLFEAVTWVCNQREHSLRERMEKISALAGMRGKVCINLREWTGW
jgi:hypothetical protein